MMNKILNIKKTSSRIHDRCNSVKETSTMQNTYKQSLFNIAWAKKKWLGIAVVAVGGYVLWNKYPTEMWNGLPLLALGGCMLMHVFMHGGHGHSHGGHERQQQSNPKHLSLKRSAYRSVDVNPNSGDR